MHLTALGLCCHKGGDHGPSLLPSTEEVPLGPWSLRGHCLVQNLYLPGAC